MPGVLGCAQEYRAAFHWRGGGQVYGQVLVDELASVEWGRTANDVSDAKIKIARQAMSPECCQLLGGRVLPDGQVTGGVEPWIHELTLYRGTELVWQGPIVRTVESRAGFQVEALDVVGWLDKVVNTWRLTFTNKPGPDKLRRQGPVTKIAETIIRLNLGGSKLSPQKPPKGKKGKIRGAFAAAAGRFMRSVRLFLGVAQVAQKVSEAGGLEERDWAGILQYLVRQDTKKPIHFERDGSKGRAIWVEYVGTILRELVKRGLLFTTAGRAMILRGKPNSTTPAIARLSLDDFLGDVEVIRDGTSAATAAWATSQDQQDPSKGKTEIVGKFGTAYGRLDTLVKVTDATPKDLRQAAANALEGRYPVPVSINVPQGAQLSPKAPVALEDLVCGQRLDVVSIGWCTQIGQGFQLSDVAGSWDGESGEKIAISLVPLSDPYGHPTPAPDDPEDPGSPSPSPSPAPSPSPSPSPTPTGVAL